jgi:hypothetical protein
MMMGLTRNDVAPDPRASVAARPYVAIPTRREFRDVELQARAVEIKRVRDIEASGFEVVG